MSFQFIVGALNLCKQMLQRRFEIDSLSESDDHTSCEEQYLVQELGEVLKAVSEGTSFSKGSPSLITSTSIFLLYS